MEGMRYGANIYKPCGRFKSGLQVRKRFVGKTAVWVFLNMEFTFIASASISLRLLTRL